MFIFMAIILMVLMMPIAAALAIYIAQPEWFRGHKKSIIGITISIVVLLALAMMVFGLMPPMFI